MWYLWFFFPSGEQDCEDYILESKCLTLSSPSRKKRKIYIAIKPTSQIFCSQYSRRRRNHYTLAEGLCRKDIPGPGALLLSVLSLQASVHHICRSRMRTTVRRIKPMCLLSRAPDYRAESQDRMDITVWKCPIGCQEHMSKGSVEQWSFSGNDISLGKLKMTAPPKEGLFQDRQQKSTRPCGHRPTSSCPARTDSSVETTSSHRMLGLESFLLADLTGPLFLFFLGGMD